MTTAAAPLSTPASTPEQLPASVNTLAQRVFADLFQSIIGQEAGALTGDVEAVHDMRVATRRLRVALSNFACCWTKEERRRLKFWLKSLADALGAVRDFDVLIDSLKLAQAALPPPERPVTAALIRRLRARRRRRFRQLQGFLAGPLYAEFKREFPTLIQPAAAAAAPLAMEAHG
jgi:CHAD domain-containing protein